MKKVFFCFLIIIICLLESDRNYLINHSIYEYYVTNFPIQILNGLHNSLNKLHNSKIIYNPSEFQFHNYIIQFKEKLFNEYKRNAKETEINAHETSKMLDKDFSYKYIFFKKSNVKVSENIKRFPTIEKFLEKFSDIQTCFLSIMEKSKVIPYHRGPYSGVLRYHFPIYMENPDKCYIEVMGTKLNYDKCFIFDDTYPHKLVKLDNSLRVVLICDFNNPFHFFKHHLY